MSIEELIRVIASMRTDLNAKRLMLLGVQATIEASSDLEEMDGEAVDALEGMMDNAKSAADDLESAVDSLNSLIKDLGGKP
jgi:hypothetical protein